jgi:hypothetical protein
VVILGGLLGWVLISVIRILADVKKVSTKIKDEGTKIVDDVDLLRENIKQETINLSDIFSFKKKDSRHNHNSHTHEKRK